MSLGIRYPKETTYFICYNADRSQITAYGIVEPTQVMKTGQPILDEYLDESEWSSILIASGIALEEVLKKIQRKQL
tara:strand:+ start:322 stop:549 length:228 start_codon:yes stop_codon:yes gene_type:complete